MATIHYTLEYKNGPSIRCIYPFNGTPEEGIECVIKRAKEEIDKIENIVIHAETFNGGISQKPAIADRKETTDSQQHTVLDLAI